MFYLGVVDNNYQGLGGLGRLDCSSVRRVKSLGLEFPANSHRVTAWLPMIWTWTRRSSVASAFILAANLD
jgi:hypothetical protein